MRKLLCVVLASATILAGCKKGDSSADGGATGIPGVSGDLQAFLKDENAPLTPEIEEKLLVAMKDCKVSDTGIDSGCQEYKNWNSARGRKTATKQLLGGSNNLGTRHIGDESPAVRLKSAELMGSLFGTEANSQKVLVEAANKEQVPGVLTAMIRSVGSRHKQNPDINALLLKNADHPSEAVRGEALSWFTTSFGGVPGTFEKVVEKIDKDPSVKLRGRLCARLYGSSDERALVTINKYLSAKDTPEELFRGCWDGMIATWTGFPNPEKPLAKGYELTMKMLNTTPRTKQRPPWTGMSSLRAAKTDIKPTDTFGQAWLTKVKPFYKKEKLVAALEGVAADTNTEWMARTGALETMKELGDAKESLLRLQKKYATLDKGDDNLVKKKIDDLLKAM